MVALSITLAAVAGFALSGAYYAVTPAVPPRGGVPSPTRSPLLQALVELLRSAAVAGLVAWLMTAASFSGPLQGAALGLALLTVPVVLLAGSVFHEGTHPRGAALHVGDWLIKLVAMGLIVGSFV